MKHSSKRKDRYARPYLFFFPSLFLPSRRMCCLFSRFAFLSSSPSASRVLIAQRFFFFFFQQLYVTRKSDGRGKFSIKKNRLLWSFLSFSSCCSANKGGEKILRENGVFGKQVVNHKVISKWQVLSAIKRRDSAFSSGSTSSSLARSVTESIDISLQALKDSKLTGTDSMRDAYLSPTKDACRSWFSDSIKSHDECTRKENNQRRLTNTRRMEAWFW